MNEMQTVKRHFFAMRNGIIADVLRKAASPYRIIFGLNLPQLVEIAASTPNTVELADALHANSSTRCSRLLAPMIHPREAMTMEKALQWLGESLCAEETDIMCHRLLRHLSFAAELAARAAEAGEATDDKMLRYGALRLRANLDSMQPPCSGATVS